MESASEKYEHEEVEKQMYKIQQEQEQELMEMIERSEEEFQLEALLGL